MPAYPETKFDRAVGHAIARENADPQGLPADILAGMEADIRTSPGRFPLLHRLLTDPGERCTETPDCKGYEGGLCSHGG